MFDGFLRRRITGKNGEASRRKIPFSSADRNSLASRQVPSMASPARTQAGSGHSTTPGQRNFQNLSHNQNPALQLSTRNHVKKKIEGLQTAHPLLVGPLRPEEYRFGGFLHRNTGPNPVFDGVCHQGISSIRLG